MKAKWHNIEQNTDEWLLLRLGKVTASPAKDMFSKPETATYQNLINRLAYERLFGEAPDEGGFVGYWLDHGHEFEPLAAELYELETFNDTSNGGFFEKDEWSGCSPDRIINGSGLLEVKCVKYTTQIERILNPGIPSEYKWQVQFQLFISGFEWLDFISFHEKLKPMIVSVKPDPVMFEQIESGLYRVKQDVEKRIELIR